MHEKHIHTYNIHTDIALNTCVQAYAPMQLVTWTRKASNATTAADFMSAQTLKPTIPTYLCIHTGVYSRISIHVNTKPCVSLVRYVYIYIKINGIYISKSISISICVYIYENIHMYMYIPMGVGMYMLTYISTHKHTYIHPTIHPSIHAYIHTTYIHACIYIYMYSHIYGYSSYT